MPLVAKRKRKIPEKRELFLVQFNEIHLPFRSCSYKFLTDCVPSLLNQTRRSVETQYLVESKQSCESQINYSSIVHFNHKH